MRIPTEINARETLDMVFQTLPVLKEDNGVSRLSPSFAYAYLALEKGMRELNTELELLEVKDDTKEYTVIETDIYNLDTETPFKYIAEKGREVTLSHTYLMDFLLNHFPNAYYAERIVLSSRSEDWRTTQVPEAYAYLADIFGLYASKESPMGRTFDFDMLRYGSMYIRNKDSFDDQQRAAISRHELDTRAFALSNVVIKQDVFDLYKALTYLVVAEKSSGRVFDFKKEMEQLLLFQENFVEKIMRRQPLDFTKEYLLKRMTNKQREQRLAYHAKPVTSEVYAEEMLRYYDNVLYERYPSNPRYTREFYTVMEEKIYQFRR